MKNNEANDGHSAVLSTAGFGGLMLITLGDLWADQCECGERAEFGASTVRGPDGCAEAVRTGRVFCDKHIPAELMPPNAVGKPTPLRRRKQNDSR